GPKGEEGEAVAAVAGDQLVGPGAVVVRRMAGLAVRAQPVVERPERAAREQADAGGVAAHVEPPAQRQQGAEERRATERLLQVEAAGEVGDRRERDEAD